MSPSRKAPPSAAVGIDIGSDSIKVAEAKFAKDGITITGLGMARTPEGVISNELIVDPTTLGAAIKALLAESGIKTKRCVSSVSGQSKVVVRVIEVPEMSRDELTETMKWEVERHVPFSPTEVVMDFQPLDKPNADPNQQNMEVLLAVAQDGLIESHVAAIQAAGLKPSAIDIEPLAAGRSVIEVSKNGAREEVIAIVNIGAHNTDLGVFENGILTFPSPPIGIAGINFTREISEALGETLEEAETTKKEYASVRLDGFSAVSAQDDQAQTVSEPTSFGTAAGPGFRIGGVSSGEDEAPAHPEATAEPAQAAEFTETADGPVFGTAGPAFDLGTPDAGAAGPSFDLGLGESAPSAGPAFDPGETVSPSHDDQAIDLGGDDASAANVKAPMFDLDGMDDEGPKPEGEPSAAQPVAMSVHHADGKGEEVFQAISGVLVDLASELRRSLEYYTTKYSRTPERVFLCGGTAKMPHLDEFLSRELGLPVQVADPVGNLNVSVTGASSQYIKEVSPLFSVSVGLAIRDMIG